MGEISVENLEFLNSKSNVVLAVNVTRLAKTTVDEEESGEEGEEGAEAEEKTSEEKN